MWKAIKDVLVQYAGSKKAVAMFTAAVIWGVGKLGLHLDKEALLPLVTPLWLYIAAQAHVDHAKALAAAKPDAPQA